MKLQTEAARLILTSLLLLVVWLLCCVVLCCVAVAVKAFDVLMGFSSLLIGAPGRPMSSAEVEAAFAKHWKQPCALVLELPERELGGQVVQWEELLRIRELCSARGIKMHLDGARIWEIQPHFRRSFQEIASLFDSVYVSFYKGLQGTTGAMLLGSGAFVADARQWQHRMGGRLWQNFSLSLAAERALNANVNSFAARAHKMRQVVAALTQAQAAFVQTKRNDVPTILTRNVPKSKQPSEPTAATAAAAAAAAHVGDESASASSSSSSTAADSSSSSSSSSSSIAASTSAAVAATIGADAADADADVVPFEPFFHFVPAVPTCSLVHMYLGIGQEAAEALRDAVRDGPENTSLFTRIRAASKRECYWEWNMGTDNARIPTDRFVRAWTAFMQKRYEQLKAQVQAQ